MTQKKRAKNTAARKRARSVNWVEAIILDKDRLLSFPNVRRIGIGVKEVAGKLTRRYCVKIYVTAKKKRIRESDALPKHAYVLVPIGRGLYRKRRLATDVVWFAEAGFCKGPADFLNPLEGGAQIGAPGAGPGTFTCMVEAANGAILALTCGHVMNAGPGPVPTNRPVTQPMVLPPGSPPGTSILLGRTRGGAFGNIPDGFLDFCVIELRTGRGGVSTPLDGLGVSDVILTPEQVVQNRVRVSKFGAVTRRTQGVFSRVVQSEDIEGINVRNVYEFKGMNGQAFGQKGDSGALVLCEAPSFPGAIVGILFATAPATPDAPEGRGFVMPFGRLPVKFRF